MLKIEKEQDPLKRAKYIARVNRLGVEAVEEEEEKITYNKKVLKMYHDYEELVFNLSEQSSNETIESIKKMSLGQRLKFQSLISERNKRMLSNAKNVREEL